MLTVGLAMVVMGAGAPRAAAAAEIKVLTAGAFKQVLLALLPEFERTSGHKVTVQNDTVGALSKRIEGGEVFDLAVLTPAAIDALSSKGKFVSGSRVNLARVAVGVMVKDGTPKPDIGSVAAFKQALLAAKSVAYIDPAAGGSSGIYVAVRRWSPRQARDRRRRQAEGKVDSRRLGRGAHCARRGRARHSSDQRNPAGEGRRFGRSAPGGNSELHGLCGRNWRAGQGERGREGAARCALGPGRRRGAQIEGHGAGGIVAALTASR